MRGWRHVISIQSAIKIGNIETKEIKAEKDIDGENNDVAAVISLAKRNQTQHVFRSQLASISAKSDSENKAAIGNNVNNTTNVVTYKGDSDGDGDVDILMLLDNDETGGNANINDHEKQFGQSIEMGGLQSATAMAPRVGEGMEGIVQTVSTLDVAEGDDQTGTNM